MTKRIILCADDFGYAEHISEAILKLASRNRISAISCITNTHNWQSKGSLLRNLQNIDIGLHFNLEELSNINSLIMKSITGFLDRSLIEQKLNQQLDLFITVIGKEPDFIDGHLHVHTFPIIRKILVNIIQNRFKNKKPYVRAISPMICNTNFKSLVLTYLAYGFTKLLDKTSIKHNCNFGGVYNLKKKQNYRKLMVQWLKKSSTGTMIMCHPGLYKKNLTDEIIEARDVEYKYLLSDDFQEDLSNLNCKIKKMNSI